MKPLPAPIAIILIVLLAVMIGVTVYDDAVIANQCETIRQMVQNPSCLSDPQPAIELRNF